MKAGKTSTASNYAQLARISNLPTCVTNVMAGAALGSVGESFPWPAVVVLSVAIGLFYVAGMAMNDLFDLKFDRTENPHRPLPQGRLSQAEARRFIAVSLICGLGISAVFGWPAFGLALALAAAITAYNWLHKRFAWACVFLGACRGLIYLIAAVAAGGSLSAPGVAPLSLILALYITGVTLVSQAEHLDHAGARRWIGPVIALIPLTALAFIRPQGLIAVMLGGCIMLAWLAWALPWLFGKAPQTRRAIMIWLSGICLVDMFFLALLNRQIESMVAFGAFILTFRAYRRIMGT